jgi:2-oxoglutarate ferredoxin oxidoreductase subunit beta
MNTTSLLNDSRPPMFCPGCSHSRSVKALDDALSRLGKKAHEVVIVSDIGCSGLFDIFFATHAFHGLHGRALTYATGIKMARPELTVIVVMGDGGLGIGGAHLLAACRRNLDLTLLILNNFNYGMTGGQCSATTFEGITTASGFLGALERPLDVCSLAAAAGAPMVNRAFAEDHELVDLVEAAVRFHGFALVDIWSICPGRLGKKNALSRKKLADAMTGRMVIPPGGLIPANDRDEYGGAYRRLATSAKSPDLEKIEKELSWTIAGRMEILILGGAGQFISTLGEVICLGAMTAGLMVSLKNDYPITVLRGHSIAEVILAQETIGYTGITHPDVVLCLAAEGVARRAGIFAQLDSSSLVVAAAGLDLPAHKGREVRLDFLAKKVRRGQQGMAALATAVRHGCGMLPAVVEAGIDRRYRGTLREEALSTLKTFLSEIF